MYWKITLEDEFNKNPELKVEDIQEIQTWMKTQAHLPSITDLDVVPFLHANEWSLDRTKQCIEAYFTYRTTFTEFFADRDPLSTEIQEISKTTNVAILPLNDPAGNRILWCNLKDPDKNHFNFASFVKYVNMTTEVFQRENGTIPGYIVVYDLRNASFSHIFRIPLSQISKCSKYSQEALSYRTTAIHYLVTSKLLEKMLKLVKPFLQPKVINMLNMHSKVETLFKTIPKEIVPKDYGGDQPTMKEMNGNLNTAFAQRYQAISHLTDENLNKLKDYIQFFLDEQKLRVDESKREKKK